MKKKLFPCASIKSFTLLRFGTQMGLIPELNYVKWYGRGPQENGNRVDVRYVEITDKDGKGLKFTAPYNTPLAFSVRPDGRSVG